MKKHSRRAASYTTAAAAPRVCVGGLGQDTDWGGATTAAVAAKVPPKGNRRVDFHIIV